MFLEKINNPSDLKKLNEKELVVLSQEIRDFMLETLSKTPGHFASSFGVVELTVALHYVFDSPQDRIVWDVGHQAYVHKILTGRKENFHTLRQLNGISGYPNIFESQHDAFSVGHSSTSISAALGMSIANKIENKDNQVVAIIGDGSMTAGLAFEGLNNAGISNSNILIILNDNDIAIDKNVGGLSKYLTRLVASKRYNRIKNSVYSKVISFKSLGKFILRTVRHINTNIKNSIVEKSNFFESLGLRYFGPIDGHNMHELLEVLKDLKEIKGPKILHIRTVKGKGYKFAEQNKTKWHATSVAFDIETGEPIEKNNGTTPPRFQDVFGNTIVELAEQNTKIVGITPAMPTGCSLDIMMKKMPNRAFDVGIAEQHAVTFSGGLARQGLIPFCNIYSSFMQRAYDQVIHDVAMQNLHVVFCLDRGGLVGADGATHHGTYDLSFFRCVPNMVVSSPMDEIDLRNLMYTAQLPHNNFPFSIRYPRGNGFYTDWCKPFEEIKIGKGRLISEGDEIAFLTIGPIGFQVQKTIKILNNYDIRPAHYDMRFVKPIDEEILHNVCKNFKTIITVEDNSVIGGFGSAVAEFITNNNYQLELKILGIPDIYIEHGTQNEQYHLCGIDYKSILETTLELLKIKKLNEI